MFINTKVDVEYEYNFGTKESNRFKLVWGPYSFEQVQDVVYGGPYQKTSSLAFLLFPN